MNPASGFVQWIYEAPRKIGMKYFIGNKENFAHMGAEHEIAKYFLFSEIFLE